MKKICFVIVLTLFAPAIFAQQVSVDETVRRLKINRSFFRDWDHWPDLEERVLKTNHDVTVRPLHQENILECGSCSEPEPKNDPSVKQAVRTSDYVVVGRVVSSISAITTNKAFVVTDFEFIVEDIWKDHIPGDPKHSMQIGQEVTVLMRGGMVRSHGHIIDAKLPHETPLRLGDRYLLFLREIPESNSFVLTTLDGFDITQRLVVPIHKSGHHPAEKKVGNNAEFLEALHASAKKAIEEDQK